MTAITLGEMIAITLWVIIVAICGIWFGWVARGFKEDK